MRSEFNPESSVIYLNAANQSLCPLQVREAIRRHQDVYEQNPTEGMARAWGGLWESQKALAQFLRADPKDLFLRPNVTSVLNSLLLGVPLPAGGEILVGELEYGAVVNICVLRAQREKLSVRILHLPTSPVAYRRCTEASLLESVVSQIGPRTKLLLLSHVLGGTGLVLPIREIAKAARERGVLFVVDGAYAPGAFPVDFVSFGDLDFYGCSLYKWMLGPKGTAFGWVNRRWQESLAPVSAGWSTFETFGPFSEFGEQSRFQETLLMTGCRDFAPFLAVRDLMELWNRLGDDAIYSRRRSLQRHLDEEVKLQLGWTALESEDPSLKGPLSAFRLPEACQARGAEFTKTVLQQTGIQLGSVSLRGIWHAVFSPHIHNDEEEVTRAVRSLRLLFFNQKVADREK
jgi:isopenicillin-N epimerase